MKVNYFKSTVRLNSFHNGMFDFSFYTRMKGKRRDSLVDRIFNCIYLDKQRGKEQTARLDGLKRKRVVFTAASLRTRRRRAILIYINVNAGIFLG